MSAHRSPGRQRGAAAVECAFSCLAIWIMLMAVWVLGQLSYQRSLIRAAARDAAQMIAGATPSERAVPGAVAALQASAENALRAAVEAQGNEVELIVIAQYPLNNYSPSLSRVVVTVNANIMESVFPNWGAYGGFAENITVEVPYGSRIGGP